MLRSFAAIRWHSLDARRLPSSLWGYLLSIAFSVLHLWRGRIDPVAAHERRGGYDIVTVVYGDELDLLRLQARSFDRFLDDAFDGDIIVVVNDLRVRRLTRRIEAVLGDYGRWRERVRIVPFHALGYRLDPANGWILQQVMKLACAFISRREWYVVFDAKNHLVARTSHATFFGRDGRALQALQQEVDCLPVHHVTSARMFGLERSIHGMPQFVPMTPFVLHAPSVIAMIRFIEAQEGVGLSDVFCDRRFLSEFLLYGAFLAKERSAKERSAEERLAKGCSALERLYDDGPLRAVTLWPEGRSLIAAIQESCQDHIVCFGVHGRYLATLAPDDLLTLESFWRHHGLLDTGERLGRLQPTRRRVALATQTAEARG